MKTIEFAKEQKQVIVNKIKRYFREEMDRDIGTFEAEFLFEFFVKELGVHFYNRGLHDAQAILQKRLDSIIDAIFELEQSIEATK